MRRQTNAYAFDQDLFASWCRGGAVWLDDDNDNANTSTTSTHFNNTSTRVEVFGNDGNGSDSPNINYNNNNFLSTNDHFNKSPGSQYPDCEGVHASPCDPDPGIVEVQKSIPDETPAIDKKPAQDAPLPLQQITSTAEICRSVLKSSDGPPPRAPTPAASDPPPRIDVHDYKPLDHPEKKPCYVCGSPWSYYLEKLTENQRQRKDQDARTVCKVCYNTVKRYAQDHATILPGTFDISRMELADCGVDWEKIPGKLPGMDQGKHAVVSPEQEGRSFPRVWGTLFNLSTSKKRCHFTSLLSSGKNEINLFPSISRGIRLFRPVVTKLY